MYYFHRFGVILNMDRIPTRRQATNTVRSDYRRSKRWVLDCELEAGAQDETANRKAEGRVESFEAEVLGKVAIEHLVQRLYRQGNRRGAEIVKAVCAGCKGQADIASEVGCSQPTVHRELVRLQKEVGQYLIGARV